MGSLFEETRESIDCHFVPMSSANLVLYGTPIVHQNFLLAYEDDILKAAFQYYLI